MVDIEKLKETMDDSGMTMVAIASKSGILRATLYKKLAGQSEFTASEIERLAETLKLSTAQRNAIFFAK